MQDVLLRSPAGAACVSITRRPPAALRPCPSSRPSPVARPPPRSPERAAAIRRRRLTAGVGLGTVLLLFVVLMGSSSGARRAGTVTHEDTVAAAPPRTPPAARPSGLDPAIASVLGYTPYIAQGTHRRREVALTFDDGPSPYTSKVLAVLRREHAVATFFEVGKNVPAFAKTVRAIVRDGSVIGDHTEDHALLTQLPAAGQLAEIQTAAAALVHAGAPAPQLFRPPYGGFDAETLATLQAQHLLMVLWSVDTKDYARPGVTQIAYTALSGAEPGAIILMHDGGGDRAQTVAALPRIIRKLHARHFRLVTVPQLLADDPPPHDQPAPRSLAGG